MQDFLEVLSHISHFHPSMLVPEQEVFSLARKDADLFLGRLSVVRNLMLHCHLPHFLDPSDAAAVKASLAHLPARRSGPVARMLLYFGDAGLGWGQLREQRSLVKGGSLVPPWKMWKDILTVIAVH